jgi:eukaryotic-like serine/threonine-protein kinase
MDLQEFDLVNQKVAQRFRIERVLGRGGMGVVYLARDEVLQEHVAFKTLMVTTPSALDRLRQEVRLARKVTHTNVARTYDIGEHRGVHYLTMEYVDGIDLESQIATSALPLARALAICTDIARGLSAAHAEGIVHRDLKPANILVARTGRVVVTDFGIAEQVTSLAQSGGGFIGTPLYMAPEQVAGEPISDKTDVYALGLLLLEMLTQRVLFFEPGGSALRAAIRRTEVETATDDELRGTSGVARDLSARAYSDVRKRARARVR